MTARREAGRVTIAVEDDGPGIPVEERERIFEPFYRLDRSRDRATGGFGLGLSIARKGVLLHGGTLQVEAAPAGGARFVVALAGEVKRRYLLSGFTCVKPYHRCSHQWSRERTV